MPKHNAPRKHSRGSTISLSAASSTSTIGVSPLNPAPPHLMPPRTERPQGGGDVMHDTGVEDNRRPRLMGAAEPNEAHRRRRRGDGAAIEVGPAFYPPAHHPHGVPLPPRDTPLTSINTQRDEKVAKKRRPRPNGGSAMRTGGAPVGPLFQALSPPLKPYPPSALPPSVPISASLPQELASSCTGVPGGGSTPVLCRRPYSSMIALRAGRNEREEVETRRGGGGHGKKSSRRDERTVAGEPVGPSRSSTTLMFPTRPGVSHHDPPARKHPLLTSPIPHPPAAPVRRETRVGEQELSSHRALSGWSSVSPSPSTLSFDRRQDTRGVVHEGLTGTERSSATAMPPSHSTSPLWSATPLGRREAPASPGTSKAPAACTLGNRLDIPSGDAEEMVEQESRTETSVTHRLSWSLPPASSGSQFDDDDEEEEEEEPQNERRRGTSAPRERRDESERTSTVARTATPSSHATPPPLKRTGVMDVSAGSSSYATASRSTPPPPLMRTSSPASSLANPFAIRCAPSFPMQQVAPKPYLRSCGDITPTGKDWNAEFQLAWELEDYEEVRAGQRAALLTQIVQDFEAEAAESITKIVRLEEDMPRELPHFPHCFRVKNIFFRVLPDGRSGRNYVHALRGVLQARSPVLSVPLTVMFYFYGIPVLAQALVPMPRTPVCLYGRRTCSAAAGDDALRNLFRAAAMAEVESEVRFMAEALHLPRRVLEVRPPSPTPIPVTGKSGPTMESTTSRFPSPYRQDGTCPTARPHPPREDGGIERGTSSGTTTSYDTTTRTTSRGKDHGGPRPSLPSSQAPSHRYEGHARPRPSMDRSTTFSTSPSFPFSAASGGESSIGPIEVYEGLDGRYYVTSCHATLTPLFPLAKDTIMMRQERLRLRQPVSSETIPAMIASTRARRTSDGSSWVSMGSYVSSSLPRSSVYGSEERGGGGVEGNGHLLQGTDPFLLSTSTTKMVLQMRNTGVERMWELLSAANLVPLLSSSPVARRTVERMDAPQEEEGEERRGGDRAVLVPSESLWSSSSSVEGTLNDTTRLWMELQRVGREVTRVWPQSVKRTGRQPSRSGSHGQQSRSGPPLEEGAGATVDIFTLSRLQRSLCSLLHHFGINMCLLKYVLRLCQSRRGTTLSYPTSEGYPLASSLQEDSGVPPPLPPFSTSPAKKMEKTKKTTSAPHSQSVDHHWRGGGDAGCDEEEEDAASTEAIVTLLSCEMFARTIKQEFYTEVQAKRIAYSDDLMGRCLAKHLSEAFVASQEDFEVHFLVLMADKYGIRIPGRSKNDREAVPMTAKDLVEDDEEEEAEESDVDLCEFYSTHRQAWKKVIVDRVFQLLGVRFTAPPPAMAPRAVPDVSSFPTDPPGIARFASSPPLSNRLTTATKEERESSGSSVESSEPSTVEAAEGRTSVDDDGHPADPLTRRRTTDVSPSPLPPPPSTSTAVSSRLLWAPIPRCGVLPDIFLPQETRSLVRWLTTSVSPQPSSAATAPRRSLEEEDDDEEEEGMQERIRNEEERDEVHDPHWKAFVAPLTWKVHCWDRRMKEALRLARVASTGVPSTTRHRQEGGGEEVYKVGKVWPDEDVPGRWRRARGWYHVCFVSREWEQVCVGRRLFAELARDALMTYHRTGVGRWRGASRGEGEDASTAVSSFPYASSSPLLPPPTAEHGGRRKAKRGHSSYERHAPLEYPTEAGDGEGNAVIPVGLTAISLARRHIEFGHWLLDALDPSVGHDVVATTDPARLRLCVEEAIFSFRTAIQILPGFLKSEHGAWLHLQPYVGLLRCKRLLPSCTVETQGLVEHSVELTEIGWTSAFFIDYLWDLGLLLEYEGLLSDAVHVLETAIHLSKPKPERGPFLHILLMDLVHVLRGWDFATLASRCLTLTEEAEVAAMQYYGSGSRAYAVVCNNKATLQMDVRDYNGAEVSLSTCEAALQQAGIPIEDPDYQTYLRNIELLHQLLYGADDRDASSPGGLGPVSTSFSVPLPESSSAYSFSPWPTPRDEDGTVGHVLYSARTRDTPFSARSSHTNRTIPSSIFTSLYGSMTTPLRPPRSPSSSRPAFSPSTRLLWPLLLLPPPSSSCLQLGASPSPSSSIPLPPPPPSTILYRYPFLVAPFSHIPWMDIQPLKDPVFVSLATQLARLYIPDDTHASQEDEEEGTVAVVEAAPVGRYTGASGPPSSWRTPMTAITIVTTTTTTATTTMSIDRPRDTEEEEEEEEEYRTPRGLEGHREGLMPSVVIRHTSMPATTTTVSTQTTMKASPSPHRQMAAGGLECRGSETRSPGTSHETTGGRVFSKDSRWSPAA